MAVEVMLFTACLAVPRDPVLSTLDVSYERSWLFICFMFLDPVVSPEP